MPTTSTTAAADADLRRILALARVPRRCYADTTRGLALSPQVGSRIIARLARYRRPMSILAVIEAAERRWRKIHPPVSSATA